MPLKDLVADLIRDKSLRRRFVDDPETVMDEYRLFKRERRILRTMQKAKVKQAVPPEMHDDIDDFDVPPGEFPPLNEDFLVEGGGESQYPSPKPAIFRYRINPPFAYSAGGARGISAGVVNSTSSKAIELTVFGQSISDPQLKLTRTAPNPGDAQPTHPYQLGTFRNSIVRAVFTAPVGNATGNWVIGEKYRVTVINLHGDSALAEPLHSTMLIEVLA